MSTPDAETAPLLRTRRSERASVLSFAKTSGVSRLDVFAFVHSRLYLYPVQPLTRRWRHPREPSTIPAPPRDDRDADRTPPAVVHPTATLVAVLAVSAYAGVTLKVRAGRRPEPPRASLLDRSARSSSPPRPITRLFPTVSAAVAAPPAFARMAHISPDPTPRPPPLLSSRSQARHDAFSSVSSLGDEADSARVAASVEYASARQTTENAKSAYDAAVREASEASAAVDAARATEAASAEASTHSVRDASEAFDVATGYAADAAKANKVTANGDAAGDKAGFAAVKARYEQSTAKIAELEANAAEAESRIAAAEAARATADQVHADAEARAEETAKASEAAANAATADASMGEESVDAAMRRADDIAAAAMAAGDAQAASQDAAAAAASAAAVVAEAETAKRAVAVELEAERAANERLKMDATEAERSLVRSTAAAVTQTAATDSQTTSAHDAAVRAADVSASAENAAATAKETTQILVDVAERRAKEVEEARRTYQKAMDDEAVKRAALEAADAAVATSNAVDDAARVSAANEQAVQTEA